VSFLMSHFCVSPLKGLKSLNTISKYMYTSLFGIKKHFIFVLMASLLWAVSCSPEVVSVQIQVDNKSPFPFLVTLNDSLKQSIGQDQIALFDSLAMGSHQLSFTRQPVNYTTQLKNLVLDAGQIAYFEIIENEFGEITIYRKQSSN